MDYSNLSDNALLAMHSGDYSKLSDDELKSLYGSSPKSEAPPEPESFGKQLLRGTLNALPLTGGALGGAAGTPAGPAGNFAGAGLGYAAGGQLKRLGQKYLLGDAVPDQTPLEQVKTVGSDTQSGVQQEMGGQILGKVLETANPVFSYLKNKFSPPVAAAQVAEAAPASFPTAPSYPQGPLVDQFGKALPSSVATAESAAANVPQIAPPPTIPSPVARVGNSVSGTLSDAYSLYSAAKHGDVWNAGKSVLKLADRTGVTSAAGNAIGKLSGVLSSNPEALGRFSQPLLKAMQGGEHSLAVTDFLMGQSSPEYREKRDSLLSQSNAQ